MKDANKTMELKCNKVSFNILLRFCEINMKKVKIVQETFI